MTQDTNNPTPELTEAALIRAAADQELSAADQARLDALVAANGEVADRVAFEQSLRSACGQAMGGPRCPDELRAKIMQIAADSRSESAAPVSEQPDASAAAHPAEQMAPVTRDRSFWSGSRAALSIAAMLMFAIAGVFIWQSAGLGVTHEPLSGPIERVEYRQRLADFVTREHERITASESAATRKFVHTDEQEAQDWFRELLNGEAQLPALSQPIEAIEFKGAGKCGVPGARYGNSAHMQIEVATEEGDAVTVSLFVAKPNDDITMQPGTTYAVDMQACGIEDYSILAWTDGIANYFLVAEGEACLKTIEAMGQPEPTGSI